jgi:DNA polymerase epsilon subunit 1
VIKIQFANVRDLLTIRKAIMPAVYRNKDRKKGEEVYADNLAAATAIHYEPLEGKQAFKSKAYSDPLDNVEDLREYDVPYYVRVAIDLGGFQQNAL